MNDSGYGSWAQYRQRLSEVRRPLFQAYCEEQLFNPSESKHGQRQHPYGDEDSGLAWREWYTRHGSPPAGEPAWTPEEGAAVVLGVATVEELVG